MQLRESLVCRSARSDRAVDTFGGMSRSAIMSKIRSSRNASTELRLMSMLRREHLAGWRRGSQLPGRPDFVWHRERVAVFVDGCFWHGHNCRNLTPRTNARWWEAKILRNIKRDNHFGRRLRSLGWRVLRIRECHLKRRPEWVLTRIRLALSRK
ncbi:MAG TPA: very short patch repair endonuclease [bacterium]|nr:very short patch repair endonuclease [bacterium]